MERISAKMFFSVLWNGICQVLGWFFGLFGYKRDGKFAKCVWGLFALSGTIIVTFIAGMLIYYLYDEGCRKYRDRFCDGEYCFCSDDVSNNVFIHNHKDGKAWIKNKLTGKKTLTDIVWISKPLGEKDSLIVFSDGKKRGYFNKYTGEVTIPAKYTHAWVFSDGIASVEENGVIKFIDTNGNQAFERTFTYDPYQDGYVFHGNYCIVDENHDHKYGLMNMQGVTIMDEEYDLITPSNNLQYWTLTKGTKSGVVDKEIKTILPMLEGEVYIYNDGIDVTMADNTMRKYDLQGNLINDFYIHDFEYLEYETAETYQIIQKEYDEYERGHEYVSSTEHKKARARLCKYVGGNNKEGLMTPDGHMVTLPKYENIDAIGPDTYICTVSREYKEILNGNGQKVK